MLNPAITTSVSSAWGRRERRRFDATCRLFCVLKIEMCYWCNATFITGVTWQKMWDKWISPIAQQTKTKHLGVTVFILSLFYHSVILWCLQWCLRHYTKYFCSLQINLFYLFATFAWCMCIVLVCVQWTLFSFFQVFNKQLLSAFVPAPPAFNRALGWQRALFSKQIDGDFKDWQVWVSVQRSVKFIVANERGQDVGQCMVTRIFKFHCIYIVEVTCVLAQYLVIKMKRSFKKNIYIF